MGLAPVCFNTSIIRSHRAGCNGNRHRRSTSGAWLPSARRIGHHACSIGARNDLTFATISISIFSNHCAKVSFHLRDCSAPADRCGCSTLVPPSHRYACQSSCATHHLCARCPPVRTPLRNDGGEGGDPSQEIFPSVNTLTSSALSRTPRLVNGLFHAGVN